MSHDLGSRHSYRAVVANKIRHGSSINDPDVVEARAAYRAAALADHIEKVVAAAPPLTNEQLAKLAAILKGGA